jgi:preprotein translocase subunit SecD
MKRNLQYRLILILVVLLGSVFLFYPPSQKIKLGLDLRGGIHLVLQVVTQDALEAKVNQLRELIEADLRENDVVFTRTRVTGDFEIEVLGVLQDQQAQLEENLRLHS